MEVWSSGIIHSIVPIQLTQRERWGGDKVILVISSVVQERDQELLTYTHVCTQTHTRVFAKCAIQ